MEMTKPNILIVEDSNFMALDLKNRLAELGYNISLITDTGKAAIREAKKRRPDLILMDIVLKGSMDGIEAARCIHEHLDIPIVYLTGLQDEKLFQRAKITEPFGYILKPFKD